MFKKTISISGMHCRSCQILIEEKLRSINQVKDVQVSLKKNEAVITASREISSQEIEAKIKEAGYDVGETIRPWLNSDLKVYKELLFSLLIIVVLYLLLKKLGISNLNTNINNSSGLLVVLGIGLAAGVSSCMAIVGGLVLGISSRYSEQHPSSTFLQKFRPHVFFNLGRIFSFFILGGLIGLVGKAFQFSGGTLGVMTIVIGIFMMVLGIQLTEISPKISSARFTLPTFFARFFKISHRSQKEYSHLNSIIIGALTFFLPCGFTQAMQIYAISTGNFWAGAAIMGVFAIGTSPGLLGIGGLTSFVKGEFARYFFKFVGLIVLILALINIFNGLGLVGIQRISFSRSRNPQVDNPVEIINGVQIVKMEQNYRGYFPSVFIIKKDIPVQWEINSLDPFSCAGSIYSQELKINQRLNQGKNIIEFTPIKSDPIYFSCTMGMYGGKFIVED